MSVKIEEMINENSECYLLLDNTRSYSVRFRGNIYGILKESNKTYIIGVSSNGIVYEELQNDISHSMMIRIDSYELLHILNIYSEYLSNQFELTNYFIERLGEGTNVSCIGRDINVTNGFGDRGEISYYDIDERSNRIKDFYYSLNPHGRIHMLGSLDYFGEKDKRK